MILSTFYFIHKDKKRLNISTCRQLLFLSLGTWVLVILFFIVFYFNFFSNKKQMTYNRSMGRWEREKDILKRKGVDLAHFLLNTTVWRYKPYVVTEVLYFLYHNNNISNYNNRMLCLQSSYIFRVLSILYGIRKRTAITVSVLWVGKLILGIGPHYKSRRDWDRHKTSTCIVGGPSTLTWVRWLAVANMSPNMGARKTPPSNTTWVVAVGFTPVRFSSETWDNYISGEFCHGIAV